MTINYTVLSLFQFFCFFFFFLSKTRFWTKKKMSCCLYELLFLFRLSLGRSFLFIALPDVLAILLPFCYFLFFFFLVLTQFVPSIRTRHSHSKPLPKWRIQLYVLITKFVLILFYNLFLNIDCKIELFVY